MEEEHTVNPSETTHLSEDDMKAIDEVMGGIKAAVSIEGKFPWVITFEFPTMSALTQNLAKIEMALEEAVGLRVRPTAKPAPASPPALAREPAGEPATGAHPECPLHKRPMDKRTKTGVPYHEYKNQRCSGEGWWGERSQ